MLNENIMHRTPTIYHFLIQLTKSFALEIKKISFSCSSDAHGQLFAKGFPSDTRRANMQNMSIIKTSRRFIFTENNNFLFDVLSCLNSFVNCSMLCGSEDAELVRSCSE